jgi:hypothetical protein
MEDTFIVTVNDFVPYNPINCYYVFGLTLYYINTLKYEYFKNLHEFLLKSIWHLTVIYYGVSPVTLRCMYCCSTKYRIR